MALQGEVKPVDRDGFGDISSGLENGRSEHSAVHFGKIEGFELVYLFAGTYQGHDGFVFGNALNVVLRRLLE